MKLLFAILVIVSLSSCWAARIYNYQSKSDGVQLGCHGYFQKGVPHTTHYIVDKMGWRNVDGNNEVEFDVVTDKGKKRNAGFQQIDPSLDYFFPDECLAIDQ